MFMPPPCTYDEYLHGMFWIPGVDKYQGAIPCVLHEPNIVRNGAETPPYLMIYCHGNAMDLGQCDFMDIIANQLGIYGISFDYNGYGLATQKKVKPSEYSSSKDVLTVYNFVKNVMNWPPERIIIYGQSIGSGIAASCAHKAQKQNDNLMGLFLHSGYTSIRDVAVSFVGFAGNFILNRFNTKEALKTLTCPLLLMHGDVDDVIPYNMSVIMNDFYTGNKIKDFHTASGRGHNNMSIELDLALPMSNLISAIEEYRAEENIEIPPAPTNTKEVILANQNQEVSLDNKSRITS